eukprot:TRINITY_DN9513_c0_g1_i1.p1 TRINITY_DN9513_c0_g1~~TRINITY_DN9513_c0_g1_i1.p1  ORF type:complete len:166 (+),score=19.12 TRINITY_DN9513_c0_g1_i1:115-612(+)
MMGCSLMESLFPLCLERSLQWSTHQLVTRSAKCSRALPQTWTKRYVISLPAILLLLTGCQDTHKVVREEIFGPVGVCLKFSTEEEVIERANNSNYGLAAALFTTNLSRAFRVEKALEAGSVWVNCYNKTDVRIPFGGYKESGFGREMSSYAIDSFTQIKAVRITL